MPAGEEIFLFKFTSILGTDPMVDPRHIIGILWCTHLFSKGPPRQWHIEELKIRSERTGEISEHLKCELGTFAVHHMVNHPKVPKGLHMPTCVHCSSADLHQMKPLSYDVDKPTTN